mmetsp:Transcript_45292/g.142477  ORF Transcript_45292/g.142477 Transcript_45292/m.142477 type:complete len:369 (-) Transcript_45292:67-1173(-)
MFGAERPGLYSNDTSGCHCASVAIAPLSTAGSLPSVSILIKSTGPGREPCHSSTETICTGCIPGPAFAPSTHFSCEQLVSWNSVVFRRCTPTLWINHQSAAANHSSPASGMRASTSRSAAAPAPSDPTGGCPLQMPLVEDSLQSVERARSSSLCSGTDGSKQCTVTGRSGSPSRMCTLVLVGPTRAPRPTPQSLHTPHGRSSSIFSLRMMCEMALNRPAGKMEASRRKALRRCALLYPLLQPMSYMTSRRSRAGRVKPFSRHSQNPVSRSSSNQSSLGHAECAHFSAKRWRSRAVCVCAWSLVHRRWPETLNAAAAGPRHTSSRVAESMLLSRSRGWPRHGCASSGSRRGWRAPGRHSLLVAKARNSL